MPKTVAVIGASSHRFKFGNKALRAFVQHGYTVYPDQPERDRGRGHPTFASVLDVPGPIDMATVYVQPDVGVRVMDDLAKKVGGGLAQPRRRRTEVVARARELGLKTIQACSIIGMGDSPRATERLPDSAGPLLTHGLAATAVAPRAPTAVTVRVLDAVRACLYCSQQSPRQPLSPRSFTGAPHACSVIARSPTQLAVQSTRHTLRPVRAASSPMPTTNKRAPRQLRRTAGCRRES